MQFVFAIVLIGAGLFLAQGPGRFIRTVCVSDRRIALIQFSWVYGPIAVVILLVILVDVSDALGSPINVPGLGSSGWELPIRFVAALGSSTWALVSAPIARLWAANKANDPETLLLAEEHLFLVSNQREIEARISVPSYYSLILSILAMSFLVFEAVLGEVFERVTGISGFVGATLAALAVATMIRPAQKRIDAFAADLKKEAEDGEKENALSAMSEVTRSTRLYLSSVINHWQTKLMFIFVVIVLFFAIVADFPRNQ